MSKRSSKVNRLKEAIEDSLLSIESTVVRNYKGEMLCFNVDGIDVYNSEFDFIEKSLKSDLLSNSYKEEIVSRLNVIERHLPYLDSSSIDGD